MSEILLCNQPLGADFLNTTCGIDSNLLHGASCVKPGTVSAFTPYVLTPNITQFDKQLIDQLSPPGVTRELTNLALSFGGDNTLAIAEMMAKLQQYNVGMVGAATSVYANRIGGFAGAVKEYQGALMAYRGAISSNAASKSLAK